MRDDELYICIYAYVYVYIYMHNMYTYTLSYYLRSSNAVRAGIVSGGVCLCVCLSEQKLKKQ